MIEALARRLETRRRIRPAACFVALIACLLAFFLVAAFPAYGRYGVPGVAAVAVATLVCSVAGVMSLAVVVVTRNTSQKVAGVLGAMLVRTGFPLACGVALSRAGGPLAEAGVFGWIVCCYLLMLFVETWLSVSLVERMPSGESQAV